MLLLLALGALYALVKGVIALALIACVARSR